MGADATAILCYGFHLGDGEDNEDALKTLPWRDEDGEDSVGGDDGWWVDTFGPQQPEIEGYRGPEWDEWRRLRVESLKRFPVEEVHHCNYDQSMYILAVRGTVYKTDWGEPMDLTPESFVVAPERIEAARAFCEQHGIEWQEPRWILCALYG